ncbi:MAG: hypothetical protein LBM71_03275 [Elusimicrobiota bacterium]|jgi:hypothetical protein|nr:hypothetical protein [Elusimicrobiota bacterium]
MPTQNTQQKQLKEQFLQALQESDTLAEALELCSLPKSALCAFIFKDKVFAKTFDKIINLKLEIALLETALRSKSAGILSFSLTNRLPKKYNKAKKEAKEETQEARQIVYVQEETGN